LRAHGPTAGRKADTIGYAETDRKLCGIDRLPEVFRKKRTGIGAHPTGPDAEISGGYPRGVRRSEIRNLALPWRDDCVLRR
jgi:hypothetical protein